ncbi:TetR/AcrR family transcriptional regulator [Gordonia sp. (in: high G+C Gram-positive bacteria)]|uniref:TetR/AcrR family transcriptional regulator n=1 Tax=Gordonia sp. (in: high G+C Gram-positive bacteria) TaxID=84139 RepID=UPI003C7385A5
MTAETSARDTRRRLLDAAAELLTEVPYDDLSVRAVCTAAGANPAAVHYHFGSKESLVAVLLEERFEPTWATALDALADRPRTVADIVGVVLDPFVALQRDPASAPTVRVLAQFVLARPRTEWTGRWFRLEEWATLLAATVPGLDADTARRRWRFAFTVLMTELAVAEQLSPENLAALSDFLTAGLTGPAPTADPAPTPKGTR